LTFSCTPPLPVAWIFLAGFIFSANGIA